MGKPRNREAKTARSPFWLIPCRAEPGMFRDEYLVHVDALDPQNPNQIIPVQLLVDQREVTSLSGKPKRNQPAEGWLRVAFAGKEKGFCSSRSAAAGQSRGREHPRRRKPSEARSRRMIYCDHHIEKAIREGRLNVDPIPDPSQFDSSSLNLRVGDDFRIWSRA